MIADTVFTIVKFAQSFILAFCCTVCKYQGDDIDEPYNIYNVNRMDKKQLYTTLSRTTKLDFIHLNNNASNNKYVTRGHPKIEIVNLYFHSDFNSGKIYKIEFKNCDKVYTGNTTGELQTRLTQHLTNNKSPVYQYRLHKPTIKLLVNAPSKGKRELEKVEYEWIYDFSEKLGDRLLNKQGVQPKRQEGKYQAQMIAIDAFQKSCYKTK